VGGRGLLSRGGGLGRLRRGRFPLHCAGELRLQAVLAAVGDPVLGEILEGCLLERCVGQGESTDRGIDYDAGAYTTDERGGGFSIARVVHLIVACDCILD
jgi:hypothetical protein